MTKKQRQRRKIARQRSVQHAKVAARYDREKVIKRRLRAKERVLLPVGREWLAVEALPLSGARCAAALTAAGLAVFEAREKVRKQVDGGPPRVAHEPIMRRVMFVGISRWSDLRLVEECRHVWRVFGVTIEGQDWVAREFFRQALFEAEYLGDRSLPLIKADAMQDFADHVCGYKRKGELVREIADLLYPIGSTVRVTQGPFASFPGVVDAYDPKADRYTVAVRIFGRETQVPCEERQLEAA
ncbi:hypothetical protein [Methylobacterium oryzisoli]|uniref:hypothetical protein n=1 Tax=Methylobacterium oryzisoli TaxID=3385502 RepID=UPI003891B001